jgi:hypothetical protein
LSLPVLIAAAVSIDAWRNIKEFARRTETEVTQATGEALYAGATWRLDMFRILGDGRDTNLRLPGEMRLIILRIAATAKQEIGQGWGQCEVSLVDDKGRRWLPLDVALSRDISRDIEPGKEPARGCGLISIDPPLNDQSALIEEKFVVPAGAIPSLAARLSVAASRPKAIGFPLHF